MGFGFCCVAFTMASKLEQILREVVGKKTKVRSARMSLPQTAIGWGEVSLEVMGGAYRVNISGSGAWPLEAALGRR